MPTIDEIFNQIRIEQGKPPMSTEVPELLRPDEKTMQRAQARVASAKEYAQTMQYAAQDAWQTDHHPAAVAAFQAAKRKLQEAHKELRYLKEMLIAIDGERKRRKVTPREPAPRKRPDNWRTPWQLHEDLVALETKRMARARRQLAARKIPQARYDYLLEASLATIAHSLEKALK